MIYKQYPNKLRKISHSIQHRIITYRIWPCSMNSNCLIM